MTKFFAILLFLAVGAMAQAQNDHSINFMPNTWQYNRVQPAYVSEHKFTIGSSFNGGWNATFKGLQFENGQLNFENPKTKEAIFTQVNWDILNVGFRLKKDIQLGVTWGLRNMNYVAAQGKGIQLGIKGNAQFVGEDIVINPDIQSLSYSEASVSYAQRLGKLQVGTRLNIYNGIQAIATGDAQSLSIYTDKDVYQLSIKSDYQLYTAPGRDVKTLLKNNTSLVPNSQGNGLGIDLGATYSINDKINLGASVIGIGNIKWNGTLNESKGILDYKGFDASGIFSGDKKFDIALNSDTLIEKLGFSTTENQDFRTSLPVTFNLQGRYILHEKITLNALFSNTSYRGSNFSAFVINGQYRIGKPIVLGLSAGVRNSYPIVGANFSLKLGFVQTFVALDNILVLNHPLRHANANGRAGLNLVF